MNIHPSAKTILCYGDSNTWGQKPDKSGRYTADVRWTGVVQKKLGENYYVIEEGLSSRTTDLDYAHKPGRNGKTYLAACIGSHNPLDVVILMLGTNDLKIEFDRSASDIAAAIHGLVDDINSSAWNGQKNAPRIILVSPILVDNDAPDFQEFYSTHYNETSVRKSQQLAKELSEVAKNTGCHFLDDASVSRAGTDGIHFDEASHLTLGTLIANHLRQMNV